MAAITVVMATPTLHYFDGYGRAEVIRLLFIHSRTQFTDHRFPFEEWKTVKSTSFAEFGQLPMLEIDGLSLIQSLAIYRYLGKKLGYTSEDPALQYKIDSLLYLREDFFSGIVPAYFSKDTERFDKWYEDNAPRFLGFLEARLTQNNNGDGWFVGDSVTLADVAVFEWVWNHFNRPARSKYTHYLDAAPKLKAFFDRMLASSAELRAYHETREEKSF